MAANAAFKAGAAAKIKPKAVFKQGKGGAASGLTAGVSDQPTYVQINGQTVEVPAGQKYVPGSAGVLNPTIQPFSTAGDMMQASDEQFNLESGLFDLDSALNKMRIDTDYSKSQITKSEGEAKSATVDNMIARGLFRSSVKDGEIYDIQATASMRRNFLDTTLNTAELETINRKGMMASRADSIKKALDRKMVENAQAANQNAPDYLTPPTQGQFVNMPQPPKPPVTPKPKPPPKPKSGAAFVPGKGYAAR